MINIYYPCQTLPAKRLGKTVTHQSLVISLYSPDIILGPVVQSVVSLTSSLRVMSLTVLADSIYNFLILFAVKM